MGEDPGWNPGLNETEALAGPGRFFYGFCFFMVLIVARMIGYMLTYGSFGTDPPTPFGVGGLNKRRGGDDGETAPPTGGGANRGGVGGKWISDL